jgi:hypothetical protein
LQVKKLIRRQENQMNISACEKCKGWLKREEDKWGLHILCVNCGWEEALWTVSDKHADWLMSQDEVAGRRTGYGVRNVRYLPAPRRRLTSDEKQLTFTNKHGDVKIIETETDLIAKIAEEN